MLSFKFKPLDGFHTTLATPACTKTMWLDLDADLEELLPDEGDWTTLAVYDGKVMEVVKVENLCGQIVFHRAFEQTTRTMFPCDSYVEFILAKSGIEAMACCPKLFENCEVKV